MNPEKPGGPLPDGVGYEARKLAAEVEDTIQKMTGEIEQLDADVRRIEQIEAEQRHEPPM